MSEHMKERLSFSDADCRSHALPSEFAFDIKTNGELVAVVKFPNRNPAGQIAEANARRLVACWNACAVFSTEELEHQDQERLFDGLQGQIRDGCAERDELVTALHRLAAAEKAPRQEWLDAHAAALTLLANYPEVA